MFLATVPIGYNRAVDEVVFEETLPAEVSVSFLLRAHDGGGWYEQPDRTLARIPYGDHRAECVAIIEKGGVVIDATRSA